MQCVFYKLASEADLDHEDARGWYDSYGWHITTENEGDVTHDAVEYDWLEDTDSEVIGKLRAAYDGLTADEAESIVSKCRDIREAGEAVEEALSEAVQAYHAGNVGMVMCALHDAELIESEHGDSPATNSLRSQLLVEAD